MALFKHPRIDAAEERCAQALKQELRQEELFAFA